jgi:hypothetical protein
MNIALREILLYTNINMQENSCISCISSGRMIITFESRIIDSVNTGFVDIKH